MTAVNFRYDKDKKDDLKREAAALGYRTLSDYLVAIVDARNGSLVKKNKSRLAPVGKDGRAVKTRVTPTEKTLLGQMAVEEGESESFLLLRQVRILITNGPHFSSKEIAALRAATNQLTAIGRNLNQILIKINSGKITDSPISRKYIEQLRVYVKEQSDGVRDLVRKTKQRVTE